jgi:hypothetical protein
MMLDIRPFQWHSFTMKIGMGRADATAVARFPRRSVTFAALAAISTFVGIPGAHTAPLPAAVIRRPPTTQAFEHYVSLTDARNVEELRQGTPFLWVDALPEGRRTKAYDAMKRGEVVIDRLETRDHGNPMQCPAGLIHHWVGAMFIPGATLGQTLSVVEDYDHHTQVYAPYELRSHIVERSGDDFKVAIRYLRKKVITVVLDTVFQFDYRKIDATHARSHGRLLSAREIKDHDTPKEYAFPEGADGGYLWGMAVYWRFVERDGGTYVQSESISLTTRVPAGMGWLLEPFIRSVPRESLEAILKDTRKGAMQSPVR